MRPPWSETGHTLSSDGSPTAEIAAASPFPRHYLYDGAGQVTHKSAPIRYKDQIRQSELRHCPGGGGGPVPVAEVRPAAERSLAADATVTGVLGQPGGPGLRSWHPSSIVD